MPTGLDFFIIKRYMEFIFLIIMNFIMRSFNNQIFIHKYLYNIKTIYGYSFSCLIFVILYLYRYHIF